MSTRCVFCDIVAGRLPAQIVYRDPQLWAFLDRRPLFKGHVLVVPAAHVETLAELDPALLGPLFGVVQRAAQVLPQALGAAGTLVAINNRISQSVPHLHVHVVPRRQGDGLRGFFWPRTRYTDDAEQEEVRATIAAAMSEPVPR